MSKKIVLYYKRLKDEVNGEYPYRGKLEVQEDEKVIESLPFISCIFKDLIKMLHKALVKDESIQFVWLQRTEREDLVPMELDSKSTDLIRKDPLTAYRNLTHEPPQGNNFHTTYARIMGAQRKHEAEAFGENIYLDVARGYILNPLTGDWSTLAYGPEHGWKIREENNKPATWLPIALIDDAPGGTPFTMRLAFARWAVVSVHSLLARQADKYYLPRVWNPNSERTWMSYEQLKQMLEEHQKKEDQCRQEVQEAE